MKTLHLFNCYKWYDMIFRGEKLEEYREIAVWKKRICPFAILTYGKAVPTDITHICFHRGYTRRTMVRAVDKILVGRGKREWGAPDHDTFIIKLKVAAK